MFAQLGIQPPTPQQPVLAGNIGREKNT